MFVAPPSDAALLLLPMMFLFLLADGGATDVESRRLLRAGEFLLFGRVEWLASEEFMIRY